MADGSLRFNFPLPLQSKLRPGEIVVDLFAGGGSVSPPPIAALARANLDKVPTHTRAAA